MSPDAGDATGPQSATQASAGTETTRPEAPGSETAGRSEAVQRELSALLDDMADLLRGTALGDLRDQLVSRIDDARHALERTVDQAQQTGAALTQRAHSEVNRTLSSSREAVHERPLTAVAIGVAAGVVIGLLMGRPRRSP
jgi:ElaB/YqjD/DUF883 family membrane-anchored ribosome-binding protein